MNIQHELDQRWQRVMNAHATATGKPNNEDDEGMRDALSIDLIRWVADLEDRVGLCVDEMRSAVFDYCDVRDTETARAVVQEAFPDCASVNAHDPRGMYVAGAEADVAPDSEWSYPVGLYLDDDGRWYVASGEDEVGVCDTEGTLDRELAIATMREFARGGAA